MSDSLRERGTSSGAKALLRLTRPHWRQELPGILFGVLASGSAVALLAASAWLITRAAEQPPILYLNAAIVSVRAFALGRAFFRYLERLASHDAAFRALAQLRVAVYERIVPLAPAGLGGVARGSLLSGLVRDVDALQDAQLRVRQPLIVAGIVVGGSIAGLALLSPAAALVLTAAVLLAVMIGWVLSAMLAARADRVIASSRAKLSVRLVRLLSRLDVLIAYDAVDGPLRELAEADAELRRAEQRSVRTAGLVAAAVSLLAGLAGIGVLLFASDALMQGAIEPAVFVLLVLTPIAVFEVVAVVPAAFSAQRQVRSAAEHLAGLLPEELPEGLADEGAGADRASAGERAPAATESQGPHPDLAQPQSPERLEVGELRLEGFSAHWPGQDARRPPLSGVSLQLRAGDRLLVTGPSGTGKSTLAMALVRLLDHQGGYLLDGVEAKTMPVQQLRARVGLVQQRPHLFDASIRHNLNFAREGVSDAELWAGLEQVGLAEWARQRGGLDAELGELGGLVSGGQAQRLALARALLADFPVLVLDEPAANVQPELAERLTHEVLDAAAAAGRIVLLISHIPVDSALITQRLELPAGSAGARTA